MKYQSKKKPELIATVIEENEKFNTVNLKYETTDEAGKTISITTSTLKRWWKLIDADEKTKNDNPLNIDYDKVNEKYPEPKVQKYVKKPQSVIDYENSKLNKYKNVSLPSFETITEKLGSICSKVNEKSEYVKFNDGSTMWLKSKKIDIYCTQEIQEKLTKLGLIVKPNKDTARPFAFEITKVEDFDKVVEVLLNE